MDESDDAPRSLRCPLCCEQFVLSSEAECAAHIRTCRAFHAEYGEGARRAGLVSGVEELVKGTEEASQATVAPPAPAPAPPPDVTTPPNACGSYADALLPLIPFVKVKNGCSTAEAAGSLARLAVALFDGARGQTDASQFDLDDLIEAAFSPYLGDPFDPEGSRDKTPKLRSAVSVALDELSRVEERDSSEVHSFIHDRLISGAANLRFCENCGKSGCRLFACTACKAVRYCGRECQRTGWAAHKPQCVPVGS